MPDLINNGLALFFCWLFAVAAIHKLRARDYYRNLLSSYFHKLPATSPIVLLIAGSELSLALLLLFPQTRGLGLLGSAGLLSIYALSMAWQIKRGMNDVACGCAGPASTLMVSPALVARNLIAAGLAMLALTSQVSVTAGLIGYGLSAAVAIFLVLLYLCSEQLISNAQLMAGDL